MILLEAKNLTKSYDTGTQVVTVFEALQLQVNKGESLVIEGASGAGKSSLLHLLGGLDRPTSGDVFYEGKSIFSKNDEALSEFRNQKLGFVFQFHHLILEMTALQNVMLPLLIRGMGKKEAENKSRILLEKLDLKKRLGHRPAELSGGEQQRVAVARALVSEPDLLLADEPTGNLDQEHGEELMDLLFDWQQAKQGTLIMVTHHLGFAEKFARKVVIKEGRLKEL